MLSGLGNLSGLLRQAQQMGSRMQELQAALHKARATGTAGGGLVEVEVNGLGDILRVTIDPDLIDKRDRELMEDLIPAAANQAKARAREHHAAAVKEMTGGLNLPGLEDALNSFTGNPSPSQQPPAGGAGAG